MSPTQELQQKICQKNGWSYAFAKLSDNRWQVEVIVGLGGRWTYQTETAIPDEKEGKAAVASLALEDLRGYAESLYSSSKTCDLIEAFSHELSGLEILDSHDPRSSWDRFWKNPPSAVGIDVEGNQQRPPVLVQIATPTYVILEAPPPGERISVGLLRLLQDDSIVKVFCDNFAHKDKKSLGILPSTRIPSSAREKQDDDYTNPPIVDLESLAAQLLGPVQVPRGLSRLVTLLLEDRQGVRIEKPKSSKGRLGNIGRFAWIEQGKAPPLRGIADLSQKEKDYAALDAWCTLHVYEKIKDLGITRNQKEKV